MCLCEKRMNAQVKHMNTTQEGFVLPYFHMPIYNTTQYTNTHDLPHFDSLLSYTSTNVRIISLPIFAKQTNFPYIIQIHNTKPKHDSLLFHSSKNDFTFCYWFTNLDRMFSICRGIIGRSVLSILLTQCLKLLKRPHYKDSMSHKILERLTFTVTCTICVFRRLRCWRCFALSDGFWIWKDSQCMYLIGWLWWCVLLGCAGLLAWSTTSLFSFRSTIASMYSPLSFFPHV